MNGISKNDLLGAAEETGNHPTIVEMVRDVFNSKFYVSHYPAANAIERDRYVTRWVTRCYDQVNLG